MHLRILGVERDAGWQVAGSSRAKASGHLLALHRRELYFVFDM
jgi:hypothetical protein